MNKKLTILSLILCLGYLCFSQSQAATDNTSILVAQNLDPVPSLPETANVIVTRPTPIIPGATNVIVTRPASITPGTTNVIVTRPVPITPGTTNVIITRPAPPEPTRLWNLQNADVRAVIDAVAAETGKNFIVDPQVQGRITLVSSRPLTKEELYQVFLSALQVLGYSAVPSGDVIKIVPSTTARALSTRLVTSEQPGRGDESVARIINVHNISAAQLIPILRPLLPESNTIAAYPLTNSILVAGEASNVNRIAAIIARLDLQGTTQSRIIPLRYSDAEQMVRILTSLQTSNQAAGLSTTLSFAADKLSNSVVVRGTADDLLRASSLIARLDRRQSGGSNTQVVYLNYLKAKDFAPILTKIALGQATTADVTTSTTGAAGNGSADILVGGGSRISIQAEPNSNALIINAPPATILTLRNVIGQLDVRPKQVLVEAVIAQVDENVLRQLGILWGSIDAVDNSNTGTSGFATTAANAAGFQLGVGFIRSGDLRGIINALYSNNATDILSTPSIMVLDNQEAKIEVGKNVALENRVYGTTGTNVPNSDSLVPFTTLERKNVSLQLKVKPQISPNRTVNLAIEQINDTLPNPDNPGTTPVINTSDIKTSVLVRSGDILVLGGLISHESDDTVTKVPLLGDVPLLGHLFRYKQKRIEKKNLIVFLRPVIVGNPTQAEPLTAERYDYMRGLELKRQGGVNLIPPSTNQTPVLPPLTTTKQPAKVALPSPF